MGKRIIFVLAVAVQLLLLSFYWYEIDLRNLIFGQSINNKSSPKPKTRTSTKKHDNFVNDIQHRQRGKLKLGKDLLLHLSSKIGQSSTGMKEKGIQNRKTKINFTKKNKLTSQNKRKVTATNRMQEEVRPTYLNAIKIASAYHTENRAPAAGSKNRKTKIYFDEKSNVAPQSRRKITEAYPTQKIEIPTSLTLIRTRAHHTEKVTPVFEITTKGKTPDRATETLLTLIGKTRTRHTEKVTPVFKITTREKTADRATEVSPTSLALSRKTRALHTEKVTPVFKITNREKTAHSTQEVSPTSRISISPIRETRAYRTEKVPPVFKITTREETADRTEEVSPTSLTLSRKTRAYHKEKASQVFKITTREETADRTEEVSPTSRTSISPIRETRAYRTEKVPPVFKITTREETADRTEEVSPTSLTLSRKTRAYHKEKVTPVFKITTREETADHTEEVSPTSLTLSRKTRAYHKEKASQVSQTVTKEPSNFPTKKVSAIVTEATTRAEATTIHEKSTLHPKNNGFRSDPNMLFSDEYEKAREIKAVELLIIVLTAPSNTRRRDIIRQTWWKRCITNEKVSCWFFTDKLESIDNSETRKRILLEQHRHHDIVFSPVGRGIQFGFRFLHLIQWGKANYDFRYIMRIDDDIMLCLDHLLWDLPNFPLQRVHYGWMHCQGQNLVYIDEGVSMFSKDVVEKFLSQNSDQIMCHPFGDQQVAVWEQTLRMSPSVYYMPDNNRIHHHPPASYDNNMKQKRDLCDNYIAIHGVYKNDMLEFWKRRGRGMYRKYSRKSTGDFCPYYPNVNINLFGGMYHHEPKPCSSKPHWNLDIYKKYPGRER